MAAASVAVLLQGSVSQAQTVLIQPSLGVLVAEAKQLSREVDSLSQQYDGLKIEVAHAKSEEHFAEVDAKEAEAAMAGSQAAVAQLAAMGYMNGGMDPTLQLLTSGNPVQILNQASTVMVVDNKAGERLTTLQREQIAAERRSEAAKQEVATVEALTQQINGKVSQINAKMAVLDSAEMTQAMVVFEPDRVLPQLPVAGRRLRWRQCAALGADPSGDPYVWAAAGPNDSTAPASSSGPRQERHRLPHYTGDQWKLGVHVAANQLQPGDLVFFYAAWATWASTSATAYGRRARPPARTSGPADLRGPLRRRGPDRRASES